MSPAAAREIHHAISDSGDPDDYDTDFHSDDDFDLTDKDPEDRKDLLQELSRDIPEHKCCEEVLEEEKQLDSALDDCAHVLGCPSSLTDDTKKLTTFSFCNHVGIRNEDQRLRMQAKGPLARDEHGVSLVSRLVSICLESGLI